MSPKVREKKHTEEFSQNSMESPIDIESECPKDPDPRQGKRKPGRKADPSMREVRKQRNRQAQAAFRGRRIEYIKELENVIESHKLHFHKMQSAQQEATDECWMLRYKNSLLERILFEKGIDVQAELRRGSHPASSTPQTSSNPTVTSAPNNKKRPYSSLTTVSNLGPSLPDSPAPTDGSSHSRPSPPAASPPYQMSHERKASIQNSRPKSQRPHYSPPQSLPNSQKELRKPGNARTSLQAPLHQMQDGLGQGYETRSHHVRNRSFSDATEIDTSLGSPATASDVSIHHMSQESNRAVTTLPGKQSLDSYELIPGMSPFEHSRNLDLDLSAQFLDPNVLMLDMDPFRHLEALNAIT